MKRTRFQCSTKKKRKQRNTYTFIASFTNRKKNPSAHRIWHNSKGMKKNAEDKRTKKISNNLKLNAVRFCFPFEFSIFAVLPIHFEGAAWCYKTVSYSNWESIHSPHLYNILEISNISPSHSISCIHPLPPKWSRYQWKCFVWSVLNLLCLDIFNDDCDDLVKYKQHPMRVFGECCHSRTCHRSTYKQIHHISTQHTRSN